MKITHKILHILRNVNAWIMIVMGGFYCFVSLLCFVLAIFGKLETDSLQETMAIAVCFGLMAGLSGVICRLGFRLKRKTPKPAENKPLLESDVEETAPMEANAPSDSPKQESQTEAQKLPQKLLEKKVAVQAAMDTFPPEKQKQFEAQFYQYTQDVGRGGLEPELAAANRGLVFVDGRPVHAEVAERMKELEQQKPTTPYQRAQIPYEVAGPHRNSQLEEESQYFILLAETNLAPQIDWGQSEYFAVDTRSWEPYYIIEQYDGAVAAQS